MGANLDGNAALPDKAEDQSARIGTKNFFMEVSVMYDGDGDLTRIETCWANVDRFGNSSQIGAINEARMTSEEFPSGSVERLVSDGYARFKAGDRRGARNLLERVPRRHQLAVESHRLLGVIAYAEGDFREAARQFERVLKHDQPRPMDRANMGLALTGLGNFARAEQSIRAALTEDPALIEGWFNLGNLYLRMQKFEPAVGVYARMIEIAPSDPRAHFNRGIAFARWHRPAEAIRCFERTLEISPGFIDARNEMGLGLAALGDQDGAEDCYRQVLIPMRHHLYPGDTSWTEQGHRFAWQMKLRDKKSRAEFTVHDPDTGRTWVVNNRQFLSPRQIRKMASRPDMILQFAHYLADTWRTDLGVANPEVNALVLSSLNGRPPELLIDPSRNLAVIERDLRAADWILPLTNKSL